jgi:hypothetical protein
MNNPTDIDKLRELAEIFWQFHNDRLKDPSITEMKPYIEQVQAHIAREVGEMLPSELKLESYESPYGRIVTDPTRISRTALMMLLNTQNTEQSLRAIG